MNSAYFSDPIVRLSDAGIDPNEAPEGFLAVTFKTCDTCAIQYQNLCRATPCIGSTRADESEAQFMPKEKK